MRNLIVLSVLVLAVAVLLLSNDVLAQKHIVLQNDSVAVNYTCIYSEQSLQIDGQGYALIAEGFGIEAHDTDDHKGERVGIINTKITSGAKGLWSTDMEVCIENCAIHSGIKVVDCSSAIISELTSEGDVEFFQSNLALTNSDCQNIGVTNSMGELNGVIGNNLYINNYNNSNLRIVDCQFNRIYIIGDPKCVYFENTSGEIVYTNVDDFQITGLKGFALTQNYPNPFNPSTTITFTLSSAGHVTLTVYDLVGREIAVLVDGTKSAGEYEIIFDAGNLPAGTYIYRLQANNFTETKKMVLVK
jgi:hypothetical protein